MKHKWVEVACPLCPLPLKYRLNLSYEATEQEIAALRQWLLDGHLKEKHG